MPTTKPFITDMVRISAGVLQNTGHVSRTGIDRIMPQDKNVSGMGKGTVLIGGTTVSPTCGIIGSHDIVSIHGATGSVETWDTQKFNTSIDGNLADNGDYTPIFSRVIRKELSHNSSVDIYSRCR